MVDFKKWMLLIAVCLVIPTVSAQTSDRDMEEDSSVQTVTRKTVTPIENGVRVEYAKYSVTMYENENIVGNTKISVK